MESICPICLEIPDLPVSINITSKQKCPFINNNLVCLRCISKMISHHKFRLNMKCICNSHYINISNFWYMCYGDINHFSDEFVEKELWQSLYYKKTKCNSCGRNFKNIKELYEHYKFYGDTCFPINKKKIIFLIIISKIYLLYYYLFYYYFNYCTILIEDILSKYCLDECEDNVCNFLSKYYLQNNCIILSTYYLTINIFIENIINFYKQENIIWKLKYQLYNIFLLSYLLTMIFLESKNLNDVILYIFIKNIIEISLNIKILYTIYTLN